MDRPTFTLSDQHNWNGKYLAPVDGCDCSRCEYLREFEAAFLADGETQSDPLPNDFNRRAA